MATRKLISTPPGTTAVLWKKKAYLVGQEVPDDFPEEKIRVPAEGSEIVAAGVSAGLPEGSGQGGKVPKTVSKVPKVPKAPKVPMEPKARNRAKK